MTQVGLPGTARRILRCPAPSASAVARAATRRCRHKKAPHHSALCAGTAGDQSRSLDLERWGSFGFAQSEVKVLCRLHVSTAGRQECTHVVVRTKMCDILNASDARKPPSSWGSLSGCPSRPLEELIMRRATYCGFRPPDRHGGVPHSHEHPSICPPSEGAS